ncbi:MAG: hypothetical protein E7371_03140 [Clostridiales bacterium]|nr:hypothetical protein [Clostridiales bacterium]
MTWINEMGTSSTLLALVCGALIFSAILAFVMRSASVYAALSAALGGVLFGGVLHSESGLETACLAVAVFAVFSGVAYLFFFCVFTLCRLRLERKKRRAELANRARYTLPQRENTYVRDRLNTALQSPCADESCGQRTIRLGHARELLVKVQSAPLTVGERLQTEEIGRMLTLYKGKENWTAREICALNDTCAFLLKLSAKYAV